MSQAKHLPHRTSRANIAAPERLRTRLVTVFALLTIAPLVLGAIISLVVNTSLAQESVIEDQESTATTIGNLLTDHWNDTVHGLYEAAIMLDQSPPDKRSSLFDLVQRNCSACRVMWLIDPAGRVQRQAPPSAAPPTGTVVMIMDDAGGAALAPINSSTSNTPPVVLLKLSLGRGSESHGVLMALIDLQQFGMPTLTSVQLEFQGYSYVFDSNGQLIISPRPELIGAGRDLRSIDLVAAALRGEKSEMQQNQAHAGLLMPRVTGVWYRMPTTGWYVMVEAPLSFSNAGNWYLFVIQITLLVLTGFGAVLLGRRLASTITWPIEQLQQGVARLQVGNWNKPLLVKRNDEIGQLAGAFNAMAQELELKHTTLQRQSEELTLVNSSLQQALEASRTANALKSQFVATISHELRTPLTAMLGFSDMLTMGFYGPVDEEQLEAIIHINESSQHLLHLINDLLDFSKLEAGKLELREEEVQLVELITTVINICTPEAQFKGLPIHVMIDPALLILLRADPLRLQQVLLNLVSNAVKFTEQGAITIHAYRATGDESRTEIDTRKPTMPANGTTWLAESNAAVAGRSLHTEPPSTFPAALRTDQLVIEVQDTGIGITLEDQLMIFDEFRQVDANYTRVRGGTGLGLAISQRLVALMGGSISVTSEHGQGSCFVIRLPLAHADTAVLKYEDQLYGS